MGKQYCITVGTV